MTDASDDRDDADELSGPPVWVKVVAAIIAVVLLLVTVLVITGGPEAHGPGRHGPRRHGLVEFDSFRLSSAGVGAVQ